MKEEIEVIMSPLSQNITKNGITVEIQIYADGQGAWILEVVDEHSNSTVWDDVFETDESALNEAMMTIKNEGILIFVGPTEN